MTKDHKAKEAGRKDDARLAKMLTVPVAVVLARVDIDSPWQDHEWRAESVIADPPAGIHGRLRAQAPGRSEFFVACDPLELHAKETEGYRVNMESGAPCLWVIMDEDDTADPAMPWRVHMVTASAHEAQDYLDPGEMRVDAVPMPVEIHELIAAFIAAQPHPEPFKKRKRDRLDMEDYRFGKEPLHILRKRMKGDQASD